MMWPQGTFGRVLTRSGRLVLLVFVVACGSEAGKTLSADTSGAPANGFDPGGDTSVGVNGADTDGAATDAPSGAETGTGEEPDTSLMHGFPSPELFVQIIGPGAESHVSSTSSVVSLAGVLFGKAREIAWSSSSGASGRASGNDFWLTEPITLSPGDNLIAITATGPAGESSVDTVVLTYTPGVVFERPAVARPSAFFTGATMRVAVSVRRPGPTVMPDTLELLEVDPSGATLGSLGLLADTGDLSADCDEIQDDGVFSRCITLESATPVVKHLRVTAKLQVAGNLSTLWSPLTPIEIVPPVTASECTQMKATLTAAVQAYTGAGGDAGATAAALASLQADPTVESAGANDAGHGIWARFHSGIVGALNIGRDGSRGAGDGEDSGFAQIGGALGNVDIIRARTIVGLAPANAQLGPFDEVPQIQATLADLSCPRFDSRGPYLAQSATLRRFREATSAGILLFAGHSDSYFKGLAEEHKRAFGWEHDGSQEILWSGDAIDCAALSAQHPNCSDHADCPGAARCVFNEAGPSGVCIDETAIDLRRGRAIFGAESYGVHPELFAHYKGSGFPDSLAYLGGCRTLFNGTLAGALFGAGCKAVAGYSDYVSSAFASSQSKAWFSALLSPDNTTGTAANFPVTDPERPSTQFALFGGANLSISNSEILNPSWETGDATGWNVNGDGRVISQLGDDTLAVSGKFMGIISTGLGYTQQTGELTQTFCVPDGIESLEFYWRFYSEEFIEFCGDVYQDTFEATLELNGSQKQLVSVKVDDLCGEMDNGCWSCGSQHVGLEPSSVSFDVGEVFNTPWQTVAVDMVPYAGKGPVTLSLFATDVGDSIYDSAILLDGILLK